MMRDGRHLDDNQLVGAYLDDAFGATPDGPPASRLHLRACPDCARRYELLAGSLQTAVREGMEEADAVFTPERLARQRDHVLRRLDQADRAARVLPFPAASVRSMPVAHGVARRWIAAAAAAGLILGLAAGRAIDGTAGASRLFARLTSTAPAASSPVASAPAPRSIGQPDGSADERFLVEVDAALEQSRVLELVAIDELTPRIVEAGTLSDLGGVRGATLDFPARAPR
jgi:hypothetical protein